jgi:GNAT superfamily N-acetyltransferase
MILSKTEFERVIPDFVQLSSVCFGKEIPAEFWRWRYLEPAGEYLAVNVRLENDNVIANYSASTLVLSYRGADYPVLLSMSTMTHPQHAGKGLFTSLATELYANARDRGYEGVIGFPNANSHGAFVGKLAWSDIYELPTLVLHRPGIQREQSECNLNPAAEFPEGLQEPAWLRDLLHVKRTSSYLNWRFIRHPLNSYSIWFGHESAPDTSYAVTKWFGDQLDLVDFVWHDRDQAVQLLRNVIAYARSKDASQINTWMPVHSSQRPLFERAGFVNAAPVTYFGARGFNEEHGLAGSGSQYQHFRNWHVQMSDSDVY